MQKCGFVSIIGLTNAGKSTLVNNIVGAKVSITSRKVQTTRQRIMGIAIKDDSQIVLLDSPGIFNPKRSLDKAMIKTAWQSSMEGDIVIVLVDASKDISEPLSDMIKKLQQNNKATKLLVLNKIDKIKPENLLVLSAKLNEMADFTQTFMISALKDKGVADLANYLAENLPQGNWLFDEDQMSDIPLRTLASEITREKIYHFIHQELPYNIYVETEEWQDKENIVHIYQNIYVTKQSYRAIILGKKGSMITNIGRASRIELEELLEKKVNLKLRVLVKENWTENKALFSQMGIL